MHYMQIIIGVVLLRIRVGLILNTVVVGAVGVRLIDLRRCMLVSEHEYS